MHVPDSTQTNRVEVRVAERDSAAAAHHNLAKHAFAHGGLKTLKTFERLKMVETFQRFMMEIF